MQNSDETKAIRQRMEEVRRDLDQDVQDIVEGARDMGDLRSYVRSYPWVCLAAAVAAGYLIVPRRRGVTRPDAEALTELVKQSCEARAPLVTPLGMARGFLLNYVGNALIHGVSAYVGQQASKHLGPQTSKSTQDTPR